jgi:hypothetical protein
VYIWSTNCEFCIIAPQQKPVTNGNSSVCSTLVGINSQVINVGNGYQSKFGNEIFFWKSIICTYDEYLRERAINKNFPRNKTARIKGIVGIQDPEEIQERDNPRGNCSKCKGKKRKTRYYCAKCKIYLCLEHSFVICKDCCEKNR